MNEQTESYTSIVVSETDDTPEIKTVNVNGENYKFDYYALKHRPVFLDKSDGPMMLESVSVEFTTK